MRGRDGHVRRSASDGGGARCRAALRAGRPRGLFATMSNRGTEGNAAHYPTAPERRADEQPLNAARPTLGRGDPERGVPRQPEGVDARQTPLAEVDQARGVFDDGAGHWMAGPLICRSTESRDWLRSSAARTGEISSSPTARKTSRLKRRGFPGEPKPLSEHRLLLSIMRRHRHLRMTLDRSVSALPRTRRGAHRPMAPSASRNHAVNAPPPPRKAPRRKYRGE